MIMEIIILFVVVIYIIINNLPRGDLIPKGQLEKYTEPIKKINRQRVMFMPNVSQRIYNKKTGDVLGDSRVKINDLY